MSVYNGKDLTALRLVLAAAIICVVLTAIEGSSSSSATSTDQPAFTKDIAPIVFEYCAACHHDGGAGPFSLIDYEDARIRAKLIADVTRSRYMPPWLPEPGYAEFDGERRLSDDQITAIQRWVDAGMPEGDAKDLPPAPKFNAAWQLGRPDLVLKMTEEFTLPAEGTDVFRNFVIPVPVAATKFVKAVEILPGNKKVVHHANLLIDRTGRSRRLDEKDPAPGFGGMEISIESESFDPDSHFLFWKPGTAPWVEPDGMAWRCEPGIDLVLNLHLQPSGKPEKIQAEIGLYFSDREQTLFPMLLQLERDGALDIPAGKKDFVVTDEFRLPVDVDALGVYPHAHYLGKDIEAWATLPDGSRRWLIRIARWDLNWQAVYKYRKPIFLPGGSVVSMRFGYDNSAGNPRNPNHPPRRVVAGNRSSDEMGHLWLQVLPREAKTGGWDSRLLLQEASMRARLKKYPTDFSAHFNLGAVLHQMGKTDEAVGHFRKALLADPRSYLVHTNLGAAMQEQGRTELAIGHYRQALRINPDYANARYNLGNLLLAGGKIDEAIGHFRQVLSSRPADAGAHNSLGSALGIQGKLDEAAAHFQRAVEIDPGNADSRLNLGNVFAMQGRLAEAAGQYEQAIVIDPKNAGAHNELGVVLARQGRLAEAIAHFETAVKIDPKHPQAVENLRRTRGQRR
jgi:Flp pilus assembly protein TadD/mono/diheme cytochrome c family protein